MGRRGRTSGACQATLQRCRSAGVDRFRRALEAQPAAFGALGVGAQGVTGRAARRSLLLARSNLFRLALAAFLLALAAFLLASFCHELVRRAGVFALLGRAR